MKVYVVYFVPDYIGIQIIKIFDSKEKAELFINNKKNSDSTEYDYLEEEVD